MALGLLADTTTLTVVLVAAAAVAAVGGWVALRLRAPERTLQAGRRALERRDLTTALRLLERIRPAPGAHSSRSAKWHAEQRQLEAECRYAAAEAAVRDHRFAEALEHYKVVAALTLPPVTDPAQHEAEASRRVVEAMLAEARRLSVASPDGPALPELLGLILEHQSPCPEASFLFGLYHLRHNNMAAGIAALEAAVDPAGSRQQAAGIKGEASSLPAVRGLLPAHVDPLLYLGAAWLREGKPRDSLRVLAEANRLAPHCPLVSWQLGTALTECGGDAVLAVRALQKATAADGLPKYLRAPHRLWAETLPAGSWVRNLAVRSGFSRNGSVEGTRYRCPLGLDRIDAILPAARLALAEALVASDRAEEAVPVFIEVLHEKGQASPGRTPAVRPGVKAEHARPDGPGSPQETAAHRGLGVALTQLGEWDAALPHLRQARAAERPASAATVGALAMCLAHAAGDRSTNIRDALGLIASIEVRADADWARRAGAVFAAAQAAGAPVSAEQVANLADVLASASAADATAAAVYDLLARLNPSAVTATMAKLYVRAAQRHGVNLASDERLFDLAMVDRAGAREFFAACEWDFAAAERLYLERWAARHPGTFPTAPGRRYAAEAVAALLADVRRLVTQSRPEAACDVARLVLKLQPATGPAYDLLAEIAYRRGDALDATDHLKAWYMACPEDPAPLARLAALTAAQHRGGEAVATARQALERVEGPGRVPFLLLAARLAVAAGRPADAIAFFDECLELNPEHPTALAGRAALAWAASDLPALVGLAGRMAAVPAEDPWFHYLAGAALLLAGHLDEAEVSAKHAAGDPALAAEGRHLLALIRERNHDAAGAAELLRDAAVGAGTAADHAVALRGQTAWRGGDYAEALRCWQRLPAARLKTWNIATVIGGTAFLAGVQALRAGTAEQAANWLRQAARLGYEDPRLDTLLTIASARAGLAGHSIELFEQAVEAAGPRPDLVRHLARGYRRAGRFAEARRLLDRAPADNQSLALERGLLLLAEGQLLPAEKALTIALNSLPSTSCPLPQGGRGQEAAAIVNLVFTRMSLGRLAEAVELLPRAVDLAPTPEWKRLLDHLHCLAECGSEARTRSAPPADWTPNDDRSIVDFLHSIGRLESVVPLLTALKRFRGPNPAVKQAEAELAPLRAKVHLDRGEPAAVREVLEPHLLAATPDVGHTNAQVLVRNLLGLCACFHQDFAKAVKHLRAALPPIGDDARVQQNLALVRGWLGDADRSAAHWQRFLELYSAQTPAPPGMAGYHARIATLVEERLKEGVAEFVI
jgi:tetratricopeptide (TPR) repeat protein